MLAATLFSLLLCILDWGGLRGAIIDIVLLLSLFVVSDFASSRFPSRHIPRVLPR